MLITLFLNQFKTVSEILNDDLYSIDFVFYTFFAPPLFYCSNAILAYCLFFKRVYNRMIIIYIYRIMLL